VSPIRVGLVCSRVRMEEKMLLEVLSHRGGAEVVRIDDELIQAPLVGPIAAGSPAADLFGCDVVMLRGLSHYRQSALARLVEAWGLPVVNPAAVVDVCGDKFRTTLALAAAGVPTPQARVAFTVEGALAAIEELGYPCVIKPTIGSWGRLVARVNDRDAAEAVLEHKVQLGGSMHKVIYLQAYIDKPGRDLRAFVVGGQTAAVIGRRSEHWITNTARGARAERVEISVELAAICAQASAAVGGGALAVDLLESGDGLLVNELNSTMEFRNSVTPTGVDIPSLLVDHALSLATGN